MITRILIVDDQTLFRAGVHALLMDQPDMEVIGEATNGKDAIHSSGKLMPDLVVSNISASEINDIKAIREIKRRYPHIKVLVLTAHQTEEHLRAALDAGADGYVLKVDNKQTLMDAVRNISSGKAYLSANVCSNVVRGYLSHSSNPRVASSHPGRP